MHRQWMQKHKPTNTSLEPLVQASLIYIDTENKDFKKIVSCTSNSMVTYFHKKPFAQFMGPVSKNPLESKKVVCI